VRKGEETKGNADAVIRKEGIWSPLHAKIYKNIK
jgi:hypothetical protein